MRLVQLILGCFASLWRKTFTYLMMRGFVKKRITELFLVTVLFVICSYLFRYNYREIDVRLLKNYASQVQFVIEDHSSVVSGYYEKRKVWKTSNLGSIMFKNADVQAFIRPINNDRQFEVLIWKYYGWLQNRHIQSFNNTLARVPDPLEECSVKNCIFTGNDTSLTTADAVVVHIQSGVYPEVKSRNLKQKWIMLSDESPIHSFTLAKKKPSVSSLANVFNWTMTYRTDADVPVPYGRTIPLEEPSVEYDGTMTDEETLMKLVPNFKIKRSDVIVATLMSNCGVHGRMSFLKDLQKYIKVDVHGKCSDGKLKKSCPGHFKTDCPVMSEYKFYLVLENSNCRQYLTEKAFHNAYIKGAIPVIMGPTLADCELLLPPKSFLHVDSFESLKDLANRMTVISRNDNILLSYHRWRHHFKIANEHGYFGVRSYHYCRVCEALNYNDDGISIYTEDKLSEFLDPQINCAT